MFPRLAVPFVVALGFLGSCTAQAQLKIILPAIPKQPVIVPVIAFTPTDTKSKISLNVPPIINTATLKITGPKAKFEPSGDTVYHGASLPDTWSENGLSRQIQQYNQAAGKPISVVTWFASAYEQGRMTSWRQNYSYSLQRVQRLGAASLIKFSTQDYAYSQTHKMAGLKEIAGGTWDDYFTEAAHTIRDFKSPVFISIDHEMNGNWYPYSQSYPGSTTTAADYVAAWRRIVQIFHNEGANNAAFVWSPNVPDVGEVPYSAYYPGDNYVDWVGISFYSGNSMSAMDEIYRQLAPRKPFFITEWATATEKNKYNSLFPGEVAWIRDFFAALETRYPRVKAISWFNWQNGDGDYRLTRVPEQAKTYAQDIANPRYLSKPGAQFADLNSPQTTATDVVPDQPVLREVALPQAVRREPVPQEKVAQSPARPVAPPTAPPIEKIMAERIGTETVPIVR